MRVSLGLARAGLYSAGTSVTVDCRRLSTELLFNVPDHAGVVLAAQGEFWARERVFICQRPWRWLDLWRWLFGCAPLPPFQAPRIEVRPAFFTPHRGPLDASRDAERRESLRAERRRRIAKREDSWA